MQLVAVYESSYVDRISGHIHMASPPKSSEKKKIQLHGVGTARSQMMCLFFLRVFRNRGNEVTMISLGERVNWYNPL